MISRKAFNWRGGVDSTSRSNMGYCGKTVSSSLQPVSVYTSEFVMVKVKSQLKHLSCLL